MATNGHFASVGDQNDKTAYEHGVQVVDENKEFKYACFLSEPLKHSSKGFIRILSCPVCLLPSLESSSSAEELTTGVLETQQTNYSKKTK